MRAKRAAEAPPKPPPMTTRRPAFWARSRPGVASEAAVAPRMAPKARRVRWVMASSSLKRCEIIGQRGNFGLGIAPRDPVHHGGRARIGAEFFPQANEVVAVMAAKI